MSPDGAVYFNNVFALLAYRLKDYDDFTKEIGYLGEEAEERALRQQYTSTIISGASSVFSSNVLMYIAEELMSLVNNALRDRRKTEVTSAILNNVIKGDYDLSAALL